METSALNAHESRLYNGRHFPVRFGTEVRDGRDGL